MFAPLTNSMNLLNIWAPFQRVLSLQSIRPTEMMILVKNARQSLLLFPTCIVSISWHLIIISIIFIYLSSKQHKQTKTCPFMRLSRCGPFSCEAVSRCEYPSFSLTGEYWIALRLLGRRGDSVSPFGKVLGFLCVTWTYHPPFVLISLLDWIEASIAWINPVLPRFPLKKLSANARGDLYVSYLFLLFRKLSVISQRHIQIK